MSQGVSVGKEPYQDMLAHLSTLGRTQGVYLWLNKHICGVWDLILPKVIFTTWIKFTLSERNHRLNIMPKIYYKYARELEG